MNVLLIVVGAIIGISIFVGYKRGFLKIIASLLATVLVVALVGTISPYVSGWIQKSTSLKEKVQGRVVEILLPERESTDEDVLDKDLARDEEIALLEGAKIPEIFRQGLLENNNSEAYAMLGVKTFGEYVGSYITKVLSDLIAFLISFVVAMIVVSVLIKVLGIVDKLPLIGGMNRIAGGAVGVGIGIMAVWVLFLIVMLFYDTSLGEICFEQIEGSEILNYLYEANPLLKYITKF